jgi:hypothetical protein
MSQHSVRIKELCARAVALPDSSPELKEVIQELQMVLREQTAGLRAMVAEGIMRPESVASTGTGIGAAENHDSASMKNPGELPTGETRQCEVKPARNLFSAILRVVLQNPLQKTFPSTQTNPSMD